MVSIIPGTRVPVSAPVAKPSKPPIRKSTLSGTIRKSEDAGLDADLMSVPSSPNKRARVTFNPTVEEKVMEVYQAKGRSLDSIRAEVKRSIEAHTKEQGDTGYDNLKEIFAPRRRDDEEEGEGSSVDMKTYLVALTSFTSLLNKKCNGLVKAILACEWMGRDEAFVKAYVQFLGSLASAQGAYVGMVLGMLVGYFHGGKTFIVTSKRVLPNILLSTTVKRTTLRLPRCQSRSAYIPDPRRLEIPPATYPIRKRSLVACPLCQVSILR